MEHRLTEQQQLERTEEYIRAEFETDGSGHDWWHVFRVRNMALKIAESEGGDRFIIQMAALLHDLDDWKLNDYKHKKTEEWLDKIEIPENQQKEIIHITEAVSFKGAGVENSAKTIEARIVQDADRLDAIGAIGIARAFAYGGSKNRLIYHPDIKPEFHNNFEAYKKSLSPSVNHFYEKLLLLKNRLNTKTAIEIAENRHTFMEDYLQHFFDELDGKL